VRLVARRNYFGGSHDDESSNLRCVGFKTFLYSNVTAQDLDRPVLRLRLHLKVIARCCATMVKDAARTLWLAC
jgi:hypothetical protein